NGAPLRARRTGWRPSTVARGGPPLGGPPQAAGRSYDSACADCGSSDSSSTSSRLITGWKLISFRTSSGMSSRSARLRSRMITSVRPAALAPRALCFTAADGQDATLQRDLAGHPDSVLHRTPRQQRRESRRHRDSGARAVLRDRPGRHVHVEAGLVEVLLVDAELIRVGTDVGERD